MKKFFEKALIRNKSKLFYRTNVFLGLVTVLSIFAISCETVAALKSYSFIFKAIEYFSVAVFTIELLGRLYAKEDRKEYVLSFYGLIDIVSIVPSYFGLANLTFLKSARIIRLLRFLRMVRLGKLSRMHKNANSNSLRAREIQIISIRIYAIVLIITVLFFSSILYLIEGDQIEFSNIPLSILWTTMVLFGGTFDPNILSTTGKIAVVGLQFSSLLLFGFLISIVGRYLERRLLGSSSLS